MYVEMRFACRHQCRGVCCAVGAKNERTAEVKGRFGGRNLVCFGFFWGGGPGIMLDEKMDFQVIRRLVW